jgi:uncharacterized protein (DUF433 family)
MMSGMQQSLIGMGLYTPAEAERLISVRAGKLVRWLRGHTAAGVDYQPLWTPQIDLGDGKVYLGFRDLMEARVADAFIRHNLSPPKVRKAIELARDIVGDDRPLSTARLRTDGRTVFLQRVEASGDESLIDLFQKQYAFRRIVEPSLRDLEFDDGGIPSRWWPATKSKGIVVDPARAFGQPIDDETGIPTAVLARAAVSEGSIQAAARVWRVPPASIRRALAYERAHADRVAA